MRVIAQKKPKPYDTSGFPKFNMAVSEIARSANCGIDKVRESFDKGELEGFRDENNNRLSTFSSTRKWIRQNLSRSPPSDAITLEAARAALAGVGPKEFFRDWLQNGALQTFDLNGVEMTTRFYLVSAIGLHGMGWPPA